MSDELPGLHKEFMAWFSGVLEAEAYAAELEQAETANRESAADNRKDDPISRLMSVSLTLDQVRDRTKTVTHRAGWLMLKPGDRLTLCRKVMGRRRGEPLDRIADVEVLTVRARLAGRPAAQSGRQSRSCPGSRRSATGQDLPQWMAAAREVGLPGIASFAKGLEHDLDAVTNGLTMNWSSGPVEGRVNHIKMVMRQMFGRAGLPLLRKLVLLTAKREPMPSLSRN